MPIDDKVHNDLKAIFSVLPEKKDTIDSYRAAEARLFKINSTDSVKISERFILGKEGAPQIPITIFTPNECNKDLMPGILFLHGGAYVCGDAKDPCCLRLVKEAGCVAVSVGYRHAPENPYPAAFEDSYSALEWLYDNAQELGVDNKRIAIVGASSGGGLAAAVSLYARDTGGPPICFQLLLYPMLDDRSNTVSSLEITDKRIWNRTGTLAGWRAYLGSMNKDSIPVYAAPARATDLIGLPPTYTFVGDLDPFRDEVIDYAARLTKAGVPTEFHLYPGCFHGCDQTAPNTGIGKRIINEYLRALKENLTLTKFPK